MANVTMRSPLCPGALDRGIPAPGIRLLVLGDTMSVSCRVLPSPSRVGTWTTPPHRAVRRGMWRWVCGTSGSGGGGSSVM